MDISQTGADKERRSNPVITKTTDIFFEQTDLLVLELIDLIVAEKHTSCLQI